MNTFVQPLVDGMPLEMLYRARSIVFQWIASHENEKLGEYLEAGGRPDLPRNDGIQRAMQLIHSAVCASNPVALRMLLDSGADKDALFDENTPLSLAITLDQPACATLLASFGATAGPKCDLVRQVLFSDFYIKDCKATLEGVPVEDLQAFNELGFSTLHQLARESNARLKDLSSKIQWLVDCGVPVDLRMRGGHHETPLHASVVDYLGHTGLALLGAGANPHLTDARGWNYLHFAVNAGNGWAVRKALELGMDPSLPANGQSTLDLFRLDHRAWQDPLRYQEWFEIACDLAHYGADFEAEIPGMPGIRNLDYFNKKIQASLGHDAVAKFLSCVAIGTIKRLDSTSSLAAGVRPL